MDKIDEIDGINEINKIEGINKIKEINEIDINMILKMSKYVGEITQTLNESIKKIKDLSYNVTYNYSNMNELFYLLDHQLLQFKEFNIYLKNNLNEKCKHNFITDYIDNSIDECKQIIYCDKCELNKCDFLN